MSEAGELMLTVRQTTGGGALAVGSTFTVAGTAWLGRSPEVELTLPDRTISRRHARLWPEAGRWWVAHHADGNGAFLDGTPLPLAQPVALPEDGLLQLGGVVFALSRVQGTVPFTTPLGPAPAAPAHDAPWVVRRDGDGCTVHVGERLLPVAPTAALVLAALARRPGVVVHGWDIQDEVGYACNLPQAVSALRRAVRALVEEGAVAAGPLAAAVASVYAEAPGPEDLTGLLRALVLARRGHGYGLMLPPGWIRLEEEG